jgi:uncharacterized protein YbcI
MVADGVAEAGSHEPKSPGSLGAAISKMIVQLVREYTGRGPTKVRTSIRDNVILVLLEDTLTRGEQSLVAAGRQEKVLDLRHEFQLAMKDDAIGQIELLTGRTVVAMMSTNHVSPDLAAEIFVLDGPPTGGIDDADEPA